MSRVKAISVFCHGECQEWLPHSQFNLLHWHKSQLCAACELKLAKKQEQKVERLHKAEFRQNATGRKAESNSSNPEKVKTRRSIEDYNAELQLKREFEL